MKEHVVVNIIIPGDQWILDKIGYELYSRLKESKIYTRYDKKRNPAKWTYYTHYNLWDDKASEKTAALFTHLEPEGHPLRERWFEISKKLDWCFSMSTPYMKHLPQNKVTLAKVGLFHHFIKPLTVGVIDYIRRQNYERKGRYLQELARKQFPEISWKHVGGEFSDEELVDFIHSCDYILVTSKLDGGPMPLFECAAIGANIICRNSNDIGYLDILKHYSNIELFDSDEDLYKILRSKVEYRQYLQKQFSWDKFANKHREIMK